MRASPVRGSRTIRSGAGRIGEPYRANSGELPGYDFAIPPAQAASAVPFKITGQKPGTAELTIHFPKRQWAPRTDPRPEAKVRIIVKP